MKKTFFTAILVLVLNTALFALPFRLEVGARGSGGAALGSAMNSKYYEDSMFNCFEDYWHCFNLGGGVFANFGLPYGFGIQPELNYNYNSFSTKYIMYGYVYGYQTVFFNTIELPLNLTWTWKCLKLYAGPVFSFVPGSLHLYTGVEKENVRYPDEGDYWYDSDTVCLPGMDFGVEGLYYFGRLGICAGLRYTLDFADLKEGGRGFFTRRYLSVNAGLSWIL